MSAGARVLVGGLLLLPAAALAARQASAWGGGGPAAAYAQGGALLDRGDAAAAAEALARAASADEPELRRRALHNLAVARLHLAGGAGGPERTAHARAAADAARDALRLGADDPGTRRNLALALRLLGAGGAPGVSGAGGTGGTGGTSGAGGAPGLTPEEAGRVLDALRSGDGGRAAEGILSGGGGGGRDDSRRKGPPW